MCYSAKSENAKLAFLYPHQTNSGHDRVNSRKHRADVGVVEKLLTLEVYRSDNKPIRQDELPKSLRNHIAPDEWFVAAVTSSLPFDDAE